MRRPTVRYTLRRMMVVIAVLGGMLWLGQGLRSAYDRQVARRYAMLEILSYNLKGPAGERLRQVYVPLRRQYEEAASYPFPRVPVNPRAGDGPGDLFWHWYFRLAGG